MDFLNDVCTLEQYFVWPLNGSKDYLMYTFEVVHVLGTLDPSTSLVAKLSITCATFLEDGTFAVTDEKNTENKHSHDVGLSLMLCFGTCNIRRYLHEETSRIT